MKTKQMKYPILFLSIALLSISCKTKYELQVTLTPAGGGIVTPQSGEYEEGEEVTIQVATNSGYQFIGWSGDWIGTENPLLITMDRDYTIEATFQESPVYLDENGVTIKCRESVNIGETHEFNGKIYTIVDRNMLVDIIQNSDGGTNGIVDLTQYCTSKVTDMRRLFLSSNNNFNISNWDVGNVTDMKYMFNSSFNGDISNWDVSNVTDMSGVFQVTTFNGDISNWDVSNVTSMSGVFNSSSFNGDISNWDVGNVTDMSYMFNYSSFNGDISNWDVSNVTYMTSVFGNAYLFNQDLSDWDVSNVTGMTYMFGNAYFFNQDLSDWDVDNVVQCGNFSSPDTFTLPKPNFSACDCNCN